MGYKHANELGGAIGYKPSRPSSRENTTFIVFDVNPTLGV